jgi:hypothetical protein
MKGSYRPASAITRVDRSFQTTLVKATLAEYQEREGLTVRTGGET